MTSTAPEMFQDRSTSTGLSLIGSEPIAPSEMPGHRIEIHLFRSADAAGAFAAGLALARRNDLRWTWQTGTLDGNKAVIVAIESEPKALEVIHHDHGAVDAEARRRTMDEIHRQRRLREEAEAIATAPLREAGKAEGLMLYGHGPNWTRLDGVLIEMTAQGHVLSADDEHQGSDDEARTRYGEACTPGVTYDAEERAFKAGPVASTDDAIAAVKAIKASVEAAAQLRKEIWHARFMASMTLTGPRLKFMRAAAEHGIAFGWSRGNCKGRAGGLEIGATETERLIRAGWIARDGLTGHVTEAGVVAMEAKI